VTAIADDLALRTAIPRPDEEDSVELLDGGRQAFPLMLEGIERAERLVHLEMYALELDDVGRRFVKALQEAARRGVTVRVTLDGWGSLRSGATAVAQLRAAGCRARIHNRFSRMLLGRVGCNHRKLLVVDGRVAFLGGINIGRRFETWDDLAVWIRGPACTELVHALDGERAPKLRQRVRFLLSGFRSGMALRREYLEAIAGARDRALIAHSYFLPGHGMLRAIQAAARRGVTVTLLLPHASDVRLATFGTRRLYRRLLDAGVRIHELTGRMMHAKAAVVDGKVSLVGSFNLDPLSMTNLEVLVRVEDAAFGQKVEQWVASRLPHSIRVATSPRSESGIKDRAADLLGLCVRRFAFWLAHWLSRHG
jgi:cardiolipin synthase A/B